MASHEGAAAVLSEDEMRRLLDERTRRYFGMSLEEFLQAYDEGRFESDPVAAELVILAGARSG